MEFCTVCKNLLYLQLNEDKQLEKHCRFCQESTLEEKKGVRISKAVYSDDDLLYMYHQNPYLKYDPTLPRINNVPCPNRECTGKPSQVIYVKYNPIKMSYFYICEHCSHTWKDEKTDVRK